MKIEISFDDGQIGDIRAASLLHKHGFKGTFYIPSCEVPKTQKLSLKEIREMLVLKYGQELGGHTVSHPMDMKLLDDEQLEFEIVNNKYMIEHLLTKSPITKFCYPRGRHDQRVRDAVRKAGYTEARTTQVLHFTLPVDPFQTPTTIHMFQREEYEDRDWFSLAKEMFQIAKDRNADMFSLWGHANEIDRQGDWGRFEELLEFIKLGDK